MYSYATDYPSDIYKLPADIATNKGNSKKSQLN